MFFVLGLGLMMVGTTFYSEALKAERRIAIDMLLAFVLIVGGGVVATTGIDDIVEQIATAVAEIETGS